MVGYFGHWQFKVTVIVPKLETALNVVVGSRPVTLDITLESLSEDGVELLDVLLQSDDITV